MLKCRTYNFVSPMIAIVFPKSLGFKTTYHRFIYYSLFISTIIISSTIHSLFYQGKKRRKKTHFPLSIFQFQFHVKSLLPSILKEYQLMSFKVFNWHSFNIEENKEKLLMLIVLKVFDPLTNVVKIDYAYSLEKEK